MKELGGFFQENVSKVARASRPFPTLILYAYQGVNFTGEFRRTGLGFEFKRRPYPHKRAHVRALCTDVGVEPSGLSAYANGKCRKLFLGMSREKQRAFVPTSGARRVKQRSGARSVYSVYRKIGDSRGRAASDKVETRPVHLSTKKKKIKIKGKKRERKKFEPWSRERIRSRDLCFSAADSLSRVASTESTGSGCPFTGAAAVKSQKLLTS